MCNRKGFVWKNQKIFIAICTLMIIVTIVSAFMLLKSEGEPQDYYENTYGDFNEFLIDGENCKIPNLNPFSKEAFIDFNRVPYEKCSDRRPLTRVEQKSGGCDLIVDESVKDEYISWWQNDIECCYQRVIRSTKNGSSDNEFSLSDCNSFQSPHRLNQNEEFIIVTCQGYRKDSWYSWKSEVYKDGHAVIVLKDNVEAKISQPRKHKGYNVLMIGIDSISRLNLIRSMPITYKYLKSRDWYEMRGFNKIAYNTFPNLMAVLTGRNLTNIADVCDWKTVGDLEKCQFIWKDYDRANYVTAYAEDEMSLSTFNYYKTGFQKPPTDYYFRPFGLAIEKHVNVQHSWKKAKCVGHQHYGDIIYQYATDLATRFQNDSFFGLYWTNSFSHDVLSMPTSYDVRMKYHLQQLETLDVLNNTIVIFFSDHGMRFGSIRKYFTGWLEERLPFLYIWLPEKFKLKHTVLTENLRINSDRLTSPYDIHVTLKHILKLSRNYDEELNAPSCENCGSLFHEINKNRSCSDAGIDQTWCTCTHFIDTDKNSPDVYKAAEYVVNELNRMLSHLTKCAKLKMKKILAASVSVHHNKAITEYLVSFSVSPSDGHMEATVRCGSENCDNPELIGDISRINRYGTQSACIKDATLRNYCYCT